MRLFIKPIFIAIFVMMVAISTRAALAMSILDSLPLFSANPWAVATLYGAYCWLPTFYLWGVTRNRRCGPRCRGSCSSWA